MDALEQARAEIDTVDAQLAALFERRMAAVLQVAEYKRAHGLPIYDAAREAAVLETDCPYMSPTPVRGQRNDSRNIAFVAETIAALWGTDAQTVLDITAANARRIYCFSDVNASKK